MDRDANHTVAVIGAGAMGRGIIQYLLNPDAP